MTDRPYHELSLIGTILKLLVPDFPAVPTSLRWELAFPFLESLDMGCARVAVP